MKWRTHKKRPERRKQLNKEFKENHDRTATATATGTPLNKRFNEQNNGCARALEIFVNFFSSSAKQQREMSKLCVVWVT